MLTNLFLDYHIIRKQYNVCITSSNFFKRSFFTADIIDTDLIYLESNKLQFLKSCAKALFLSMNLKWTICVLQSITTMLQIISPTLKYQSKNSINVNSLLLLGSVTIPRTFCKAMFCWNGPVKLNCIPI